MSKKDKDDAHNPHILMQTTADVLTHFNKLVRERELCPICAASTLIECMTVLAKQGILKDREDYTSEEREQSPYFIDAGPVRAVNVGTHNPGDIGNA